MYHAISFRQFVPGTIFEFALVVVMHLDVWLVNRQLQVIGPDTIAMGIWIANQASQQYLMYSGT